MAPTFLSTRFSIKDKLAAHSDDATTIGLLNVNPASRNGARKILFGYRFGEL
jgi:hypothetical protein